VKWLCAIYVCALAILGTIGGSVNLLLVERAYVDNRAFPGGPLAYLAKYFSLPTTITGFVSFVLATWLQDGYLVSSSFRFRSQLFTQLKLYRFMAIYHFKYYIVVFPILMYLGSIGKSNTLLSTIVDKFHQPAPAYSSINFANRRQISGRPRPSLSQNPTGRYRSR
jgi:hypothetical protein